jgi:hypothetical protein
LTSDLPEQLRRGLEHLNAGRALEAADAVTPVFWDAELAVSEDLRDIRLRCGTLLAQALLQCGRIDEVDPVLKEASRLAESTADNEGRAAITGLRAEWAAAFARRGSEQAQQAGTDRFLDQPPETLRAIADGCAAVRERVLARLALARGHPDEAEALLKSALDDARTEESFTLMSVIVRTAELHGLTLPADPYAGKIRE